MRLISTLIALPGIHLSNYQWHHMGSINGIGVNASKLSNKALIMLE